MANKLDMSSDELLAHAEKHHIISNFPNCPRCGQRAVFPEWVDSYSDGAVDQPERYAGPTNYPSLDQRDLVIWTRLCCYACSHSYGGTVKEILQAWWAYGFLSGQLHGQ